jgi:AcrR family transcriptional regulator
LTASDNGRMAAGGPRQSVGRTGRRPGNPATRERILTEARRAFAESGYTGASLRHIAARAEVDPALIHHYFGTKEQLFLATVQAPINPGALIPQVFAGGPDGLGERLVRTLLTAWDNPEIGPAGVALLRGAMANDASARLLREFLTSNVLRRVVEQLGVDQPALRGTLVASQVFGIIGVRYLLRIEPLASAAIEVVAAAVGPNIDRYLTDPDVGRAAG